MDYLSIFLIGTIVGMLINMFLHAYFAKSKTISRDDRYLVTKDDIAEITAELGELRDLLKKNNEENANNEEENETIEIPETEEILEAEKEFYDSIAGNE